jgi:hypothetical protein
MSIRPPLAFLGLFAALAGASRAQNCVVGPPFGLGTVVVLPGPCPSGPGALPNTTCLRVEVSCEGLLPVLAQVRITEPAAGTPPRGTVVFGTGGSGTGFYGANPSGQALFQSLLSLGFRVVDRAWDPPTGWMGGGAGIRNKSCRYATLLTWIHDDVHTGGAFCATGNSGGSAEIGYAMTTWGREAILDLAVPTSGPPLARLDYACTSPVLPEWAALCPTIVPPGVMMCMPACTFGPAGNPVCFDCSPTPTLQDLRADSVVHLDADLAYPPTRTHFLFGTQDCGQSIPMGLTWATVVASEKKVEFVPDTPHALFSTTQGREAIRRAIAQLPRLLATGTPSPGGTLHLNAFGPPGRTALLFLGLLPASFTIPGFFGTVGIGDPAFVGPGVIGANETFVWSFALSPSLSSSIGASVRFQAVLDLNITNTEVVTLVP